MNLSRRSLILSTTFAFAPVSWAASDRGTPDEAKAMLAKAVAYLKANGKDKAFAQFQDKAGGFVDRDLYVSVIDLSGKTMAHGTNPRMVGKDNTNFQDADGKFIVKERVDTAKAKGRGTQEYRAMNPVTKDIESKVAFFEKVDDLVVTCGAFKL